MGGPRLCINREFAEETTDLFMICCWKVLRQQRANRTNLLWCQRTLRHDVEAHRRRVDKKVFLRLKISDLILPFNISDSAVPSPM